MVGTCGKHLQLWTFVYVRLLKHSELPMLDIHHDLVLWGRPLSQDQFCTTQGVPVGHGGNVVLIRTPVRPNSNSAEFCAWVVLNYSSYVVLG